MWSKTIMIFGQDLACKGFRRALYAQGGAGASAGTEIGPGAVLVMVPLFGDNGENSERASTIDLNIFFWLLSLLNKIIYIGEQKPASLSIIVSHHTPTAPAEQKV